jgi:hypothetical protein
MNKKGQFSVIAAMLVAVVLITAVMFTFSAIRNISLQDEPLVMSAIDETNGAIKQLLGYTVGYYGSVLQVTANYTYAQMLATNYLQSGVLNLGNIHPEWAISITANTPDLQTDWFGNESSSRGSLAVTYNLTGIGISGINYTASCELNVRILNSTSGQTQLMVTGDNDVPLLDLGKSNFMFYIYSNTQFKWELTPPISEPTVFANGSYQIPPPTGIDPNHYFLQVLDQRGIITVASSFTSLNYNLTWPSTPPTTATIRYVNNNTSDVDSSPNKGTQSNFTAQKYGPDSVYDTLIEANTGGTGSISYRASASATSQGSLTNTKPTGTVQNDVMVANIYVVGTNPTITAPSGWTLVLSTLDGTTARLSTYYKVAGASEPASYQWTFSGASMTEGGIITFYGVITSNPIDVYGGQANAASTSYTAPSVTTTVSNAMLVAAFGAKAGGGSNTVTPPAGMTERYDVGQNNNGPSCTEAATVAQASAGASGTKVATGQSGTNIGHLVALKPALTTNYQLDLEEQWQNVNYTSPYQKYLCIKTGTLGTEPIKVDVWNGSTWINSFNSLTASSWNNASVSSLLASSNFTIRFKGSNETSDLVQDNWQIDATLIQLGDICSVSNLRETITVENLQNGSMRWLGQNLRLTTEAQPIPPLPVKSIHINQTINGVSNEVPFQIEDWASNYRIPLGLTGNMSVFNDMTMLVSLINSNVSQFTIWWNGSDKATQTPLAYTNRYFTADDPSNGKLTNGKLTLQFGSGFTLNASIGSSSSQATFMRINNQASRYGSSPAYTITRGIIRDVVQQEAEWSNGVTNCPNLYAHIVVTLPANSTYYTYQLRPMFVNSTQNRTITDFCPLNLTISTGLPQTENGTVGGYPTVVNGTGQFYNSSASSWTHHWSQFISGTKGAGIMFTDDANSKLYVFDNLANNKTGSLRSNSTTMTMELLPVSIAPVSFQTALDVIWYGAVAAFDGTTPIYQNVSGTIGGLWMTVEYPPTVAITEI